MKFMLRFFGLAFLACALAALAYDGTRMLANGELVASSLRQLGVTFAPDQLVALEAWGQEAIPYLWTAAVTPLLLLPSWMTLAALGSLLYLAGHRPKPPEIIADF